MGFNIVGFSLLRVKGFCGSTPDIDAALAAAIAIFPPGVVDDDDGDGDVASPCLILSPFSVRGEMSL